MTEGLGLYALHQYIENSFEDTFITFSVSINGLIGVFLDIFSNNICESMCLMCYLIDDFFGIHIKINLKITIKLKCSYLNHLK